MTRCARMIGLLAAILLGSIARAADEPNSLGMRFCTVKAGQFAMGSVLESGRQELRRAFPDSFDERAFVSETPRHEVRITRAFELGVHEVTVGQFRRFLEAASYRTTAERSGEGMIGFAPPTADEFQATARQRPFARRAAFTWRSPGFEQTDDHPVVGVSYEDAAAFCRWLSERENCRYRLPTEAEWELACRSGTTQWFHFGDLHRRRIHRFANVANVELERAHPQMALRQWLVDVETEPSDGAVYTSPVGRYEANAWGLYDVHGNVWEWCEDRYLETAYRRAAGGDPTVDPRQDLPQDAHGDWRVIRGGAWCNGPIFCRSAVRGFFDSADAACYLGFRVVREPPR